MESPVKATGWTGRMDAPRTMERKRKGRETDRIFMPTPPREHDHSHFPTPESVRRPAKPVEKAQMEPAAQTLMPTPQTLPRPPRKVTVPDSGASATDDEIATPPSPSGHTTFFLSSSSASGSRGEKISRRRPGLTFAQQMGLLSTSYPTQPGSASRPGVGVGMGGGVRSGGHKKDQVVWGHLAEPVALQDMDDENLFLVVNKAPGRNTSHQPRQQVADEDVTGVEPLKYRQPVTDPMTGLLTPPPTRPERGVRTIPKPRLDPAAEARRLAQKAQMEKMMDIEANPFLVKPGESSHTSKGRRSPIVDESQPTVTYVFRGAKKVFANPFYPSDAPFPQALLDPEDEEYEPHPNPKPRLLFPSPPPAPSKRGVDLEGFDSPPGVSPPSSPTVATPRRKLFTGRHEQIQLADHDEDDEDEEMLESTPPTRRRLFAAPPKRSADVHTNEGREEKKFKGMRV